MKGNPMSEIPNACGYCDHSRYQPEEEGGGVEFCALDGREINVDAEPPVDCRLRSEQADDQPARKHAEDVFGRFCDALGVEPELKARVLGKEQPDTVPVRRAEYDRLKRLAEAAVAFTTIQRRIRNGEYPNNDFMSELQVANAEFYAATDAIQETKGGE